MTVRSISNFISYGRGGLSVAFGRRYEQILCSFATKIRCGNLILTLPNGVIHRFTGDLPGPTGDITIHKPRAVYRLFLGGSIAFAESYIDCDWSSKDLSSLLELAARNESAWRIALRGNIFVATLARVGHWRRRNSRRGSRRNIASHYDLGNEFYRTWLDASMTYSAGLFSTPGASLEQAQLCKFNRLIELLQVSSKDHLLDIGSGWGEFAIYASQRVGCRVTAITISEAQHAECVRKLALSGMTNNVEFRLQDYRDVEGEFDRIVSVEMIEAVGEAYWPVYFERIQKLLAPRGLAVLQAITIKNDAFHDYRRQVDFIQRHIFPGGMLPSRQQLTELAKESHLRWVSDYAHGADYARTIACWASRFEIAWPHINEMGFDERFRRIWRYYLAYCKAGFLAGRTDLMHVVLTHSTHGAKELIR